ncbi:MAG TPA: amidase [Acidimicrobiales bacterium]|nr:amidase [Acidimicrobiales bacterium]
MTRSRPLDEYASLGWQAEQLAAGEVSSAELVAEALERAEQVQAKLNPFRVIRAEKATAEAARADERLSGGERLPLLGVPVAIKDDSDIEGETTAFGCAGDFTPKTEDCEAVRRLRAAGAIVIGKTNTPEFGQWPWTESTACGPTLNPWNPDFTPGGSSGGSAVAVATGIVAAAMGSDGAGSVRIPASWNNLIGIKPQRGRISTWPDAEAFNGITCHGTLARNVADAALLLDVLTGNHPDDIHKPPPPPRPYAEAAAMAPPRLRIALSKKIPFSLVATSLDPEVERAVASVAERIAGLGHEMEDEDPPYGLVGVSFVPRSTAGVADWCRRVPDQSLLDPRTRANGRMGRVLGGPILRLARRLERPFARRIGRIFERFDVVVAPTTAQPPIPIGAFEGRSGWATDQLMAGACPYAWPWNVLGWPSINVPAGFTASGLPVGAQLIGPANSEDLLISLAAQLESVSGWSDLHPSI